MKSLKNYFLTSIISILLGFFAGVVAGVIIGVKLNRPNLEKEVVTTATVLDTLQDQSFLVTRTLILDQEVEVKIDQGSAWSNWWWGHEVTAEGLMQIDIGVDLAKISEEDIQIDKDNKQIKVVLPESEIYDVSLDGPIEVKTKSGILKKLFDSDDNEDYNLALTELKTQAENSVKSDEKLLSQARTDTLKTLNILLGDTGYEAVKIEENSD